MKLSQFKLHIPDSLLATHPAKNREDARLMVIDRKTKKIARNDFADIALRHADKRTILNTIVSGHVNEHNTNTYIEGTLDVNKPRVVTAGVPMRMPEVMKGDLSSK